MPRIPEAILHDWPLPNYVDPPKNPATVAVYVFNGFFLTLATITVAARLYTRIIIRNWFGLDDLFIILAFLHSVGVAACAILGNARYAWNLHVWDTPVELVTSSAKLVFAIKILWSLASCTIRMSLLCFFYRILDHCQVKQHKWVLHCMMGFVVSVLVVYLSVTIFACIPIHAYWTWPRDDSAVCIDEGLTIFVASILNTLSEFLVALLPIPVIMRLRMERKQQCAVVSLLSLGFLVTVVGCVRTYYVWVSEYETMDFSWYSVPQWICAAIEIDVALICASAPALRPLVTRIYDCINPKLVARTMPFKLDQTTRRKSLTTQQKKSKLNNATERYGVMYTSHASTVLYHTVDWDDEGTFEDNQHGYGNTVSVTALGHHNAPRKGGNLLKGWHKAKQENVEALEMQQELEQVSTLKIVARRSLDIRESWHESELLDKTHQFWSSKEIHDGPTNIDWELERSNVQLGDCGNLVRRFSAESKRPSNSSERKMSTAPSKSIESTDAQSTKINTKEHDRLRLVSSSCTTVDAEPTPPQPALLRRDESNGLPSPHPKPSQDDNMTPHLRKSLRHSRLECNSGLPASPQEDRTMWSHAFEKVFEGDTSRDSWLP